MQNSFRSINYEEFTALLPLVKEVLRAKPDEVKTPEVKEPVVKEPVVKEPVVKDEIKNKVKPDAEPEAEQTHIIIQNNANAKIDNHSLSPNSTIPVNEKYDKFDLDKLYLGLGCTALGFLLAGSLVVSASPPNTRPQSQRFFNLHFFCFSSAKSTVIAESSRIAVSPPATDICVPLERLLVASWEICAG